MDQRAQELVQEPNFGHVTTLREDGSPFSVVVWVDTEDERFVLNTAEGRNWRRFVERDPRIELVVVNRENPYEYVRVRGRVEEATHEDADDHIDRMAKKYLGVDSYPGRTPDEQRVKLYVRPERVKVVGAG